MTVRRFNVDVQDDASPCSLYEFECANGSYVSYDDYADLQRKAEALVVENDSLDTFIKVECWTIYDVDAADSMPETPATDAALADIHDRLINDAISAISESGAQTVGDAIVAVASMRKDVGNEY